MTARPISDNSTDTSSNSPQTLPRWWCIWCGSDLPDRYGKGRNPKYCSPACAHDDMTDAHKGGDRLRYRAAYLALRHMGRCETAAAAVRRLFL